MANLGIGLVAGVLLLIIIAIVVIKARKASEGLPITHHRDIAGRIRKIKCF